MLFLFGVNLLLGYFAMLVAMTYSVELFLCILSGMILGHGLLNSRGPVAETVDPCCAGQNGATAAEKSHETTSVVKGEPPTAEKRNSEDCCSKL